MNGDGKLDVVFATNQVNANVVVLYNQGNDSNGNPVFYDAVEFIAGAGANGLDLADLNQDGAIDYAGASANVKITATPQGGLSGVTSFSCS